MPSCLVDIYHCVLETCCLIPVGRQKMEAVGFSKILINFYQTVYCHISEDSNL